MLRRTIKKINKPSSPGMSLPQSLVLLGPDHPGPFLDGGEGESGGRKGNA